MKTIRPQEEQNGNPVRHDEWSRFTEESIVFPRLSLKKVARPPCGKRFVGFSFLSSLSEFLHSLLCALQKGRRRIGAGAYGSCAGAIWSVDICVEFSFLRLCPSFFIAFYVLCKKERRGFGAGVRCGERLYGLC